MDIFTLEGIIRALLAVGVFGGIVLIGEFLRRSNVLVGEGARKFVHVLCGTWAALWPIFLDLRSIAFITILLAAIALIARRRRTFRSIYSINRLSMGEVLIGFGIGLSALLAESGAVYASAVLIISWSDSMAALIGTKYGKKNSFTILRSRKSLIGSLAFFVTTFFIVCAFLYYESSGEILNDPVTLLYGVAIALFVSFSMTIVELTGVYGLDNLTIPVFATIVLGALAVL